MAWITQFVQPIFMKCQPGPSLIKTLPGLFLTNKIGIQAAVFIISFSCVVGYFFAKIISMKAGNLLDHKSYTEDWGCYVPKKDSACLVAHQD